MGRPYERLHEVESILREADGVDVEGLSDRLGVSRRTAFRYLDRVREEHGGGFHADPDGRRTLYRLDRLTRETRPVLRRGEDIALVLARALTRFAEGTDFATHVDALLARLAAHLPEVERQRLARMDRKLHLRAVPRKNYARMSDALNEIVSALRYEQRLRFTYEPSAASRTSRITTRADPYTLVAYRGNLYLVARSEAHGVVRTFLLDRMSRVRWLLEPFTYPTEAEYSPEAFFRHVFGIWTSGQPAIVRLRFHRTAAKYVSERVWARGALTMHGSSATLKLRTNDDPELRAWILSFGRDVEVLAPPGLRAAVAAELAHACSRYGDDTSRPVGPA